MTEPQQDTDLTLDGLSDTQLDRFSRHLSLDGFGPEAQLKLLNARILVIGAGGLGAPVLTYLAAAGVGSIDIVDHDVVDRSNLHRQVIHSEATIGQPKTASAAAVLRGLHPEIRVTEHRDSITADNALDLVRPVDLVIDGSDNFATRYLMSDACEITGTPLVYGSILRFAGQVALFHAGAGPTYRDLFPEPPAPGEVPSCADAGVLGVLPGIIGTLMAAEAIKQLTGLGRTLLGRLLTVDALTMTFRQITVAPDPQRSPVTSLTQAAEYASETGYCELSGTAGASGSGAQEDPGRTPSGPGNITVRDLAAALGTGQRLRVVDVRETWEHRRGAIPDSENVPLQEVLDAPGRWADTEVPVVFYCQSGVRSERARTAVAALSGTGAGDEATGPPGVHAPVRSLTGGYEAWSRGPIGSGRAVTR